ncbi:MAG: argininosuccinate lyase [Gammaproteobacteria bacterium]
MKAVPDHDTKNAADTAEKALEIGARLEHGPSQTLIDSVFRFELDNQLHLSDALNRVDLAHTLVMAEAGIVPSQDARNLLSALCELGDLPPDFRPEPSKGDLYTNREAWLIDHTPAGTWLGAGRARREAITTAYVITLREALFSLMETLVGFGKAVVSRAEENLGAFMPDYTYLQTAQPTTFGHYLLGFNYPVLRDIARIQGFYGRLNLCPAGCGSSNGSRLPQSRERQARLLGFDGLVAHARDAMWQADLQIELVSILTAILINLDRLAEDLQIFTSEEFSLLELDDKHARASKVMPQKKNPFALTHIRGMANVMIGHLAGSAALGRTPTGQPDNRLALYGTVPKAVAETRNAVALMTEVVACLKFDSDRGRMRLDTGFSLASDLAEVLVEECGVSFREAHRLVGSLVKKHLASGNFQRLTVREISAAAKSLLGKPVELSPAALQTALDPEAAIAARNEAGGAAVSSMIWMLNDSGKKLDEADQWRHQLQLRMQSSDKLLKQGVEDYLTRTMKE